MDKVRIELNSAGIAQLLKSSEMQAVLSKHAKRIAGSDGETETYVAPTRAVSAAYSNKMDNGMLRRMK